MLLVLARLALLVRISVKCPSFYLTLLRIPEGDPKAWFSQIAVDLAWVGRFSAMKQTTDWSFEQWVAQFRERPKFFIRSFKSYLFL